MTRPACCEQAACRIMATENLLDGSILLTHECLRDNFVRRVAFSERLLEQSETYETVVLEWLRSAHKTDPTVGSDGFGGLDPEWFA